VTPHDTTCFHCGEGLPALPVEQSIEGQTHRYCCAGCAAAAMWIHDAHLDDYYRLRSDPAGRVQTEATDLSAWDEVELIDSESRLTPSGREITLVTDGMRCAACAWLIDRALSREAGVIGVSANAVTGRIRIEWNPHERKLSALLRRLLLLGYRPALAGSMQRERQRREDRRRWLLRVGLAGLGTVQAMMFAEALYLDTAGQMPLPTRDFLRWITFLIATPVVFWSGWPFLSGAWRELRERMPGMDTLVATSVLLAWGASTVETLRGGPQVWFDAAVMFVFLLLLARMLERRARSLAAARVDALAQAQPRSAMREREDQSLESIPVARLKPGDIVRVAAGATLPADGVLLDDEASFSEALLTGESRPVRHVAGDAVLAGSGCGDRAVRVRVTATGARTRLSELSHLVLRAQEQRPRIARIADRIASRFVVVLLLAAIAMYLLWLRIEPARAFEVALSLLVISCPCALSLSVPAALAAAHGTLSRIGALAVRADALDTLSRVSDVVFDKTGTLGGDAWRIADVETFNNAITPETALQWAAALERDVHHPIAGAFQWLQAERSDGGAPALQADAVQVTTGQGISGIVNGRALRLGTAPFAAARTDDGAVWLGDGAQPLARFALQESQREGARETVQALRQRGLALHLFSGDGEAAVQDFARNLDLPAANTYGRLSPEDKLSHLRELQSQGRIVAMVGDGLNDAPVLAGADVSIAVPGAAPLAQQSADLVLTAPSLQRLPRLFALAARTRAVIRQNLALSLGYNLIALPLAAMGMVRPWIAALAMVVSSLTVTLNALRLSRDNPLQEARR
jgi:Cu2+-exporting ATPase